MSESTRAYWYRIANAVIPILVSYGLIADREAAVWAGLVAAVFSTGLATKHTSTSKEN